MARNLAQLAKDADEEDPLEDPIPKGLMDDFGAPTPPAVASDDEDMPPDAPEPVAAAPAAPAPVQSETQKLIASFSPNRGTPPPPRASGVPALAEAQRNQAFTRNMGAVSDALAAAFSRRPTPKAASSTLGEDTQAQLALGEKETALNKGEDELAANRAVLSKVMGQDLSGMSMAGINSLSAQLGLDKKLEAKKNGVGQTPEKKALIAAQAQSLQDKHEALGTHATELEAERKKLGDLLHMDLTDMPDTGIKAIMTKLGMDQRKNEHAGVAATAAEAAEIRRQRLGITKDKFAMTKGQNQVAGFEDEKPMQPGQAKDLADSVKSRELIHQKTQAIRSLIQENGGVPWNPASATAAKLNMLWAETQPLLTANAGMGGFTEGHRHLFTDATGAPVSITNVLNPERLTGVLDEMDKSANESTHAMAGALGTHERPKGVAHPAAAPGAPPPPAASPAAVPAGKVKVKRISDGKTGLMSADDPALKSGKYVTVGGV